MEKFGLTWLRIAAVFIMSILVALLEGFGMAMLLPILEYIEYNRDISALVNAIGRWSYIVDFYNFVGIGVSLVSLVSAALVVILLRSLAFFINETYSAWLTQTILHQTRSTLFDRYLTAKYSFFDKHKTGEIINLMTVETSRLGGYFNYLFQAISKAFDVLFLLGVLMWLSVSMTLFGSSFLLAASFLVAYVTRHSKTLSRKITEANQNLNIYLVERLTALRLIKLTDTANREAIRGRDTSSTVRRRNFRVSRLGAGVGLLFEPTAILGAVLILYLAIAVFHMTLPQVGLFLFVLMRLQPMIRAFLQSRQKVQAVSDGFAVVSRALDETKNAHEETGGRIKFQGLKNGIEFINVKFSYLGARFPALDGLNLEITAGKMTALVGPSGAGKSTLVDLLPRLRDPSDGKIYFDGIEVIKFDLGSLRRSIAFVSQEAFIFNDTVRANLCFGKPEASDQEIRSALKSARAEGFVENLPDGLETVLGERGMRLSGGERQRLSLARALIQNAPILVLDEPTSSLDSEIERDIQESIFSLRDQNKTTIIVIAHRLSTINRADKIVVLKGGRIVQEGNHNQLMATKEWYAKVSGIQGM